MNLNGMDPVAVLAQLRLETPSLVVPVSGGRDAAIWRAEHHGRLYALRVFRPEQAPVAAYEVAAMQAAPDGGVPVPNLTPFLAWAGVFMLNDITHWLERDPALRRRVGQWVARWQRRVGVA